MSITSQLLTAAASSSDSGRRKDTGACLLCVASFVVLASPTTDHPCPCQGILWSTAHKLCAQVRALSAVSWATFQSPAQEFHTLDCASLPQRRLALFLGKTSFGDVTLWGRDLSWITCGTAGSLPGGSSTAPQSFEG